jgi:hypothetical protein
VVFSHPEKSSTIAAEVMSANYNGRQDPQCLSPAHASLPVYAVKLAEFSACLWGYATATCSPHPGRFFLKPWGWQTSRALSPDEMVMA